MVWCTPVFMFHRLSVFGVCSEALQLDGCTTFTERFPSSRLFVFLVLHWFLWEPNFCLIASKLHLNGLSLDNDETFYRCTARLHVELALLSFLLLLCWQIQRLCATPTVTRCVPCELTADCTVEKTRQNQRSALAVKHPFFLHKCHASPASSPATFHLTFSLTHFWVLPLPSALFLYSRYETNQLVSLSRFYSLLLPIKPRRAKHVLPKCIETRRKQAGKVKNSETRSCGR